MPGLFGYTASNGFSDNNPVLKKMRDLLIYRDCSHKSEEFFCKDGVNAGYCAPDFENTDKRVYEDSGTACWFDGEIYSIGANTYTSPVSGKLPKELIASAYKTGALKDFLRGIDGYFSAVIYDSAKRRITLITDRYGFRHLYYSFYNGKICWASECKAFLAMPDFKICVNRQSIDEFMKFGFLCEDRTWLDGVFLLNPATVLTYDMQSGSVRMERYWSPDEIRSSTGKIDVAEYCEEWGRLFNAAVAKKIGVDERVGITLSGGLDSRAILAAMPLDGSKINAVTLGDRKCDDAEFAAMAAELKGTNHRIFPFENDGWFERATMGVWATDGALSLSSQAGIEHLSAFSAQFGVSLNGLGGSSIMQWGMSPGSSSNKVFDNMEGGIPGAQTVDRRMLRQGFRLDESFFKVRMPFYDAALYSFMASLPQEINSGGNFYKTALLHNFPQYYRKIPWQQAGIPIGLPFPLFDICFFYNRLLGRFKRKLRGLGLPVFDSKLCFSISETLRFDGNRAAAEKLLADKNAFYPQYLPENTAVKSVHKYADTWMERKCRILTFEIWMRQIHDPSLRPLI